MAGPNMGEPREVSLQVQGLTVPGPSGAPVAALIFDYGISAHKILMEPEAADQLAAGGEIAQEGETGGGRRDPRPLRRPGGRHGSDHGHCRET